MNSPVPSAGPAFEYFYESHLKSVLDPDDQDPHFHKIHMGRLSRFPETPIQEAVRAARLLGERLGDPVLCLSGGLDSEAMACAFLLAGVPFRAATMAFKGDLNRYDIRHAEDFCRENGITLSVVEIDPVEFLKRGEHLPISRAYRTLSAERALFIRFLQLLEGDPVLGGEILRMESPGGELTLQCPKDRDFSYWRYLESAGRKGAPYFHYYTPELAFSFLAHTRIAGADSRRQNWNGRPGEHYLHKLAVYREGGFQLAERPERQQKWHGFEGLKIHFDLLGGSTEFYNHKFRKPYGDLPLYDLNQFLLVDETDTLALQILENQPPSGAV